MSHPILTRERFLFPSANDVSAEAVANPGFATDLTGWTGVNGTLTRDTTQGLLGGTCAKLVKTVAPGTYAFMQYDITPPRGVIVPINAVDTPESYRIVGPYDTLASAANFGSPTPHTLVQVDHPERWAPNGTFLLGLDARYSGAPLTQTLVECAYGPISGNQLLGTVASIRHEPLPLASHTYRTGSYIVGTKPLRRWLGHAWVMRLGGSTTKAYVQMFAQYLSPPSTWLSTGDTIASVLVDLPDGVWTLIEIEHDFVEKNLQDSNAAKATRIGLVVGHDETNANGQEMYVDEARAFHVTDLSERQSQLPDPNPRDVGIAFERTAGGQLRGAKLRDTVDRYRLRWDGSASLKRDTRDRLLAWHQDMLYPSNTMRSFDYQPVDYAHADRRMAQAEVAWRDTAPRFNDTQIGTHFTGDISLEVIDPVTTIPL